jgi:hypothetical protein
VKTTRLLSLAVVGALATGALPLLVADPAEAGPSTPVTVVTGGDLSADGSSGWAVESRNTGAGAFVAGTGTPPLGSGSYFLQSKVTGDKQFLHLTKVAGVPLLGRPLTDLTGLTFSSFAADGTYSPYVNIPIHSGLIDANSDGIADGAQPGAPGATGNAILVYEPTVAGGAWGTSDTMAPTALWRLTRPVISGGTIPVWTYQNWSTWTSILTDGKINPTYGDIQWVIGDTSTPAWGGRTGWVDDIQVSTTTESAIYDLEEGLGSCPVAIDTPNKTLTLTGDCTTNSTLTLHDGWTLDGAGYTITAVDPAPSTSFTGPVLTNEIVSGGATMDVKNVHIVGNLADGCSNNLYGVQFNGAAGSFTDSTVADIKYGAGSGCQGGNSIDITNLGGATRLPVTVDDVQVTGFQKTGIRANGNVALDLTNSSVASSDLDLITASNSLQISRGARAYVAHNTFGGNDWDGNGLWSATGVLLYGAEDVTFTRNVVTGSDTDFGIYVADAPSYDPGRTTLTCNLIERDPAPDSTPTPATALDLWNTGVAADSDLIAKVDATGNTVSGFATPYDNVVDETGGPCASGPVTGLAVDGTTTSVTASWSAPSALSFAPVASYDVTLTPGGATQTVTGTTATFTGLTPAKEYTVTVVPVNAAGSGTPASASGTTGPGAATITSTATTATTASLDWTVPGDAYTGFDLTVSDSGGVVASHTANGDARTWTFTGLDPQTGYTLAVTPLIGSTSGAADSADVTTPADTGTPPSAPGPVTGLSLDGSGTTLTATWTAAAGATDYEATLIPGGQVDSVSGTTATFTVVPGKEFTVTVVAHNANGWGPGRSSSLDTALPSKPSHLTASGAETWADLTWSAATSPSPIASYTVTATPTSGSPVVQTLPVGGLTFPVRVAGLARNTTYTFAVTATNPFGTGAPAAKTLKGSVTSLKVDVTTTIAGHPITLRGKVVDADTGQRVSGQKVYLYRKVKGTTTYVHSGARATTAANGTFSFTYHPKASARYYVTTRGAGRMGAKSASTHVSVKGRANLKLSRASVKSGATVTFSGKVRPQTGSTVALQRKQGSSWVTKKTATPNSSGGFSFRWKTKSHTDYFWRVRVYGPTFKPAVSAKQLLVVS